VPGPECKQCPGTLTPQSTSRFIERDPDYTKPGPWDTTLFIGNSTTSKTLLTVTVVKHGNTFSTHWINDQLLFVQIRWGRVTSSDIVLNADTGTPLYDRLARYDELVEPCK
jgi:hypothetical protein